MKPIIFIAIGIIGWLVAPSIFWGIILQIVIIIIYFLLTLRNDE